MKRLLLVIILLSVTLCVRAITICDTICDHVFFDMAKVHFFAGQYPEAIEKFVFCRDNCPDYREYSIQLIDSCKKEMARKEIIDLERQKKKEDEEWMKRIKQDGKVYFSIQSNVPGQFSKNILEPALRKGLPYTTDSLSAYWFIRVVVAIQDESNDENQCYRVFAALQVEDAIATSSNGDFFQNYGICSKDEPDGKLHVANVIYNHHLFNDMKDKILEIINVKNIDITKDSTVSSNQKQENVGIYIISSPNNIIKKRLLSRLRDDFIKANGRYTVIDEYNEEHERIIREIYDRQEHRFTEESQAILQGHNWIPHKVCVVDVVDVNENGLEFYCTFKEIESDTLEKSVSYPRFGIDVKVCSFSEKGRIEIVADVLALQLGLLSEEQQIVLENRIEQFRKKNEEAIIRDSIAFYDSIGKMFREDMCRSWWPGRYQRYYGQKTKDCFMETRGYLYPIVEGISVIGIVGSSFMIGINYIKGCYTTDPIDRERFIMNNKTIWVPALISSGGVAVASYIVNVLDAHNSISQRHNSIRPSYKKNIESICLNPVITDKTVALTLKINF